MLQSETNFKLPLIPPQVTSFLLNSEEDRKGLRNSLLTKMQVSSGWSYPKPLKQLERELVGSL